LLATRILGKALREVSLNILKDRDQFTDAERQVFLDEDASRRMLTRHEIENYLFDKEALQVFCLGRELNFDEARYDAVVNDIYRQDLKPVQQAIQASCGFAGTVPDFKRQVGTAFHPDLNVYRDLETSIFP